MNRLYLLLAVVWVVAIAGIFGTGFAVGRATTTRPFVWQWDSHGPGIELVPYSAVEQDERGWSAQPPIATKDIEDVELMLVTARRWDIRWRDTDEGEGFMLWDGTTLQYDGDPHDLWFRLVEYHPPEVK
jgi:hypothetical protein